MACAMVGSACAEGWRLWDRIEREALSDGRCLSAFLPCEGHSVEAKPLDAANALHDETNARNIIGR